MGDSPLTGISRNPWKLDLWGWDPFDYAVRQARDFSLKTDLNVCDRDLIPDVWLMADLLQESVAELLTLI